LKQVLLVLLIVLSEAIFAQPQEPLYYFITKDSLVGVKDNKGKIIIPAKHRWMFDRENGEKVPNGIINLYFAAYSRNGEFLYTPLIYDFSPDEIHEGATRFTENGKTGYVNRQGKKIIPAQFEFTWPFSLGTAKFCKGCYFDRKKDVEHPPLTGGAYGFIDRKGKVLIDQIVFDTTYIFWNKLDSITQTLYPDQFRYSDFEKKLVEKFDPYKKEIEKEYFSNWTSSSESRSLVFDIVEKPSLDFPYYVIYSRELIGKKISGDSWDRLQFYVSKNGKNTYYIDNDTLITFSKWYSLYINGKREYE